MLSVRSGHVRRLTANLSVGNVPYVSRISKRTEYLPVAVSFLSPPGKVDFFVNALIKLIRCPQQRIQC